MTKRVLVLNKKANFDYEIKEVFEAGIVLFGFEVKSLKLGKASLTGSFVLIKNNEAFLIGAKISPYQEANTPKNYLFDRDRKLLLAKKEIIYLSARKKEGLVIVPLSIFIKKNLVKVKIALAKPLKKYQKKQKLIERQLNRELERSQRPKNLI